MSQSGTHTFISLIYALHSQRSMGRRNADQGKRFFDRYEATFLFVSLSLIGAGVADEAKPAMLWLMEEGLYLLVCCAD